MDAVFDLARETEFLGHVERDGLHALEHDRNANHSRHEDGRERRRARRATAANGLADLRKHEQEDEAQEEGLDQRAQHELAEGLSQHD